MQTQQPPYERKPFQRSLETAAIINLLREIPVGKILTYEGMEKEIGFDPRDPKKAHHLRSAIEIVGKWDLDRNEPPVFLKNIPNAGYMRLADAEAVRHATTLHQKRFRADTKKFKIKVEGVDPAKMVQPEDKQAYGLAVQLVNLRESISSKRTEKFIKKQVAGSDQGNGMNRDQANDLLRAIAESGFKG